MPGSTLLPVNGGDIHPVPQTRLAAGTAATARQLQIMRERASLLVTSDDEASALGLDAQALNVSRRAASQWATRYATHLVVLLVVGLLVTLGGLKAFTVQGAYTHVLQATGASAGTDHLGDNDGPATDSNPSIDSQDYALTLPRTELGGSDASASSAGPQTSVQAADQNSSVPEASAGVVQYTVATGDTIASIAEKFKLMPETVMGSNGIFDLNEDLAPGRVLTVLPVDGMYYVAGAGDTVESIARRFQVTPDVIQSYIGNDLSQGLQAGQPLVVPGGMMPQRESVIVYKVRAGETLKEIAARFGIDVPTMINSNDIPDPDNLQIGSVLRVLPVEGMEYKVRRGDTINAIADRLGVTPQMILDYSPNHLDLNSRLQIDQMIMVPGGSPPEETTIVAARVAPSSRSSQRPPERPPVQPEPPRVVTKPDSSSSDPSNPPAKPSSDNKPAASKPDTAPSKPAPKPQPPSSSSSNSPKVGTGRFMWPVNGTITQYFTSRHNGLDIAIAAGTPIHAADSGKVIWAGWRTDGLGYCVMIDHLNGYTTVYGHMIRQPAVYVGQYVGRGQVIGYIGSTGHSTGPHVHFMVKAGSGTSHSYRNPLAFLR